MKLGFEISHIQKHLNSYIIYFICPEIRVGYLENYYIDEKWFGIKLTIKNDIHFERYDYGWLFSFVVLGFGIKINKIDI